MQIYFYSHSNFVIKKSYHCKLRTFTPGAFFLESHKMAECEGALCKWTNVMRGIAMSFKPELGARADTVASVSPSS